MWLPLTRPQLGTWPITQACDLTRNQTGDLLVCRPALSPLNYTHQGNIYIFYYTYFLLYIFFILYIYIYKITPQLKCNHNELAELSWSHPGHVCFVSCFPLAVTCQRLLTTRFSCNATPPYCALPQFIL